MKTGGMSARRVDDRLRFGTSRPKLFRVATVFTAVGLGVSACGLGGPSTATEVCADYEELAQELGKIGGFFDNPVFWDAKALGRTAVRYESDPGVVANGELLIELGEGDSISGTALDNATTSISPLCGQRSLSAYTARITLGLD